MDIDCQCVKCNPLPLYEFSNAVSSFAPPDDSTHLSNLPVADSFATDPSDDSFATEPTTNCFAIDITDDSDSSMPPLDDMTFSSFQIPNISEEDLLSDDSLPHAAIATQTPPGEYCIIPNGSIHNNGMLTDSL